VEDGDVAGRKGGRGGGGEQGGTEDEGDGVSRVLQPGHTNVPSLDVGRGGGPGVRVPGGGGGGGRKHYEEAEKEKDGEEGGRLHDDTVACDLMMVWERLVCKMRKEDDICSLEGLGESSMWFTRLRLCLVCQSAVFESRQNTSDQPQKYVPEAEADPLPTCPSKDSDKAMILPPISIYPP